MAENGIQLDGEDFSSELESLRQREQDLNRQRIENEAAFGQQRAKFMELFRQKEDELRLVQDSMSEVQNKNTLLEEQVRQLTNEIDEIKTTNAILEFNKDDEVSTIQRKFQEEIASMQHIMKESISQAHQNATEKYEIERVSWLKSQEKLQSELQELRNKLSQEREGFLSSITKTLQKKVGTVGVTREEQETLEYSMRKAQEDTELLRSVVGPLEEEIAFLNEQLKDRMNELAEMKSNDNSAVTQCGDGNVDVEEKVKELHHSLQTEKASRTDLEMYVAVLNTQKSVLQEDNDRLRSELHEVCKLLELEKHEQNDLKRTWQMANDQFLESQRLMMMDMRRLESVLSTEQQRQITEMKKKDSLRDMQEKRVRQLEEMREREEKEQEQRRLDEQLRQEALKSESEKRTNSTEPTIVAPATSDGPIAIRRSQSNQSLSKTTDTVDSSVLGDTLSLNEDFNSSSAANQVPLGSVSLTEDQQKSLIDPTPETKESETLLANARAKQEMPSMVGRRLVSETEWQMLQKEVSTAREKVGKPCDMCANYESQLQSAQENEKKTLSQLHTLERHLQGERQAMTNQEAYTKDLEISLRTVTEESEMQINTLVSKLQESEKFMQTMKEHFERGKSELYDQLKCFGADREEIQKELTRLQEENESLVNKHSKHAQEMQEEAIDLPNTVEEMQLVLLKYREDLITAKVAEEHSSEVLKSEIMFLRTHLVGEQQERNNLEESLTQEISQLQNQIDVQKGINSELSQEKVLRLEIENKLKQANETIQKCEERINALSAEALQHSTTKAKLEQTVQEMRAKITSLQVELDNSEDVQRDFVKLSQSLQIQLEKIRAAENEVRWQHEEDIDECNSCKLTFSVTRRKHHCKHCGQVFCMDCLSKIVNSGPNMRPSKVCDVCHTILVKDATPYFSREPLHSPD